MTETNATHAQVNRPLLREFAEVIARDPWDVLLLQEEPPHWPRPLARAAAARGGASARTSRNVGSWLRRAVARLNPDLIASGEGGSNAVLVRAPWRIAQTRRLTLTWMPERRRLLWTRLEGPLGSLCVGNLHATAGDVAAAARDVQLAAAACVEWSGDLPLVLGGDFNLRPARDPEAFARLEQSYGLRGTTAPMSLDHLLARGLDRHAAPHVLPPAWRELRDARTGLLLRLSDHHAVAAEFVR